MIDQLKTHSNRLFECEINQTTISPLTTEHPHISVEEAYQIQLENVERKIANGDEVVGKKIGLTSLTVQKMFGVNEPDYGHLFKSMGVPNNSSIDISTLIQPKIEGEIAFVLKEDLVGPNVTALDVIRATDYVVAAIEIVDSRIENWQIKLQDTVADNASSAKYVLGDQKLSLEEIDLELLGMVVKKNGELINTGVGAAALGNPLNCVAWLANKMAEFNIRLKAGEVILSGALSGMVDVKQGDKIRINFSKLGEVQVQFQ